MRNTWIKRRLIQGGALSITVALLLAGGLARAELLVLPASWSTVSGAGEYVGPDATPVLQDCTGATWTYGGNPLGGAPWYSWWYGCTPTAAGMMIGWWDSQPGRGNLFAGDASTWYGDLNSGTKHMVASLEHATAGAALGYTYGSYQNHAANCLADFLRTENGGTEGESIAQGLAAYAAWDDPATATNEAHNATAYSELTPGLGGTFTWSDFTAEIDAGRPVLLDVVTYYDGQWRGHSVFAYGYMNFNGYDWYAVHDTWSLSGLLGNGDYAAWYDGTTYIDNLYLDGVEWWPYFTIDSGSYDHYYDWRVAQADFLFVDQQPEPATLAFLVAGLGALVAWRRRRTGAA